MQNAQGFVGVNKNCNRYQEVAQFLQVHEPLFEWRPEEMVLDAGCGPGDITADVLRRWLPSHFRALVGVDVSQQMVKHARRTYDGDKKLAFFTADIAADVTNILLNQEYAQGFDKVFSFCVLHWLGDLERGIKNLHTLLRPGGQALLNFPIDRYFQRTFKAVRARKEWREYFMHVDREMPSFPVTAEPAAEFLRLMTSSGFQVAQCQVRDCYTRYDSADDIKGLIESLDQDGDCVPLEMKERYLNDCLQIMEDLGAVDTGSLAVKQIMLSCFARKSY